MTAVLVIGAIEGIPHMQAPVEALSQSSYILNTPTRNTPALNTPAKAVEWDGKQVYGYMSIQTAPPVGGWLTIRATGYDFSPDEGAPIQGSFVDDMPHNSWKRPSMNLTSEITEAPETAGKAVSAFIFDGGDNVFQVEQEGAAILRSSMVNEVSVPTPLAAMQRDAAPLPKLSNLSDKSKGETRYREELVSGVDTSPFADSLRAVTAAPRAVRPMEHRIADLFRVGTPLGIYAPKNVRAIRDPSTSQEMRDDIAGKMYLNTDQAKDISALFAIYRHEMGHVLQEHHRAAADSLARREVADSSQGRTMAKVYGSETSITTVTANAETQAQEFAWAWAWLEQTADPTMSPQTARQLLAMDARIYPHVSEYADWLLRQRIWAHHPLRRWRIPTASELSAEALPPQRVSMQLGARRQAALGHLQAYVNTHRAGASR